MIDATRVVISVLAVLIGIGAGMLVWRRSPEDRRVDAAYSVVKADIDGARGILIEHCTRLTRAETDLRRLRAEIADLRRRIDPTPSGECGEPPATGPHTDSSGQASEPESRSPGAREHGDPAAPTAA